MKTWHLLVTCIHRAIGSYSTGNCHSLDIQLSTLRDKGNGIGFTSFYTQCQKMFWFYLFLYSVPENSIGYPFLLIARICFGFTSSYTQSQKMCWFLPLVKILSATHTSSYTQGTRVGVALVMALCHACVRSYQTD